MEIALGGWIASLFGTQQDVREMPTMMGHSGPIPQSGQIVLRLYTEPDSYVPQLLREAVWDAYRKETWSASNNEFTIANPGTSDIVKLMPTKQSFQHNRNRPLLSRWPGHSGPAARDG